MMNDIQRLRNEITKARRNATSKISRTKRTTGANVAGSEFDPRRSTGVEKRYNKVQLNAYLRELKSFNSRNTQFVPGAKGSPILRHRWNVAVKLGQTIEELGKKHQENLSDIKFGDNTIGGINAMLAPPKSGAERISGPYTKFNKKSDEIRSADALESLIKSMRVKITPGYLKKTVSSHRDSLVKSLEAMGEYEFSERVADLSQFRFEALWENRAAMEAVFLRYNVMQKTSAEQSSPKERWQDSVIDESFTTEFNEFLGWSESLPETRDQAQTLASQAKKQNRKKRR